MVVLLRRVGGNAIHSEIGLKIGRSAKFRIRTYEAGPLRLCCCRIKYTESASKLYPLCRLALAAAMRNRAYDASKITHLDSRP